MNDESVPTIRSAGEFVDEVIAEFANEVRLRPLRQAVKDAATWQARLSAIRALYEKHIALGEDFEGFDPYSLELHDYWTPIEWRLWQDVRPLQVTRFLPQFPVGRFFIDFADPEHRIGIEADGKQYHDKAKDRKRDQELWNDHGWKVFRVSGAETFRIRPSPWEWEIDYYQSHGANPERWELRAAAEQFFLHTSTGVAWAMQTIEVRKEEGQFSDEMVESLDAHRLASFPIGA